MSISIKEVAQLAGVSISTVSRVLNGKSYVNDETRKKVLTIINRENYRPNIVAQSLKNGSSNTICVMIPSIQNVIFGPITRGVEDVARKNGFTVILCNTDEDKDIEKLCINKMRTRWIDGFVIASSFGNKNEIYSLQNDGIPVVLVNRFDEEDVQKMNIVSIDNYQAGYDATEFLIKQGNRKIAIAVGNPVHYFYRERLRGYTQALHDYGLPCDEKFILIEKTSNNDFYQQAINLMKSITPPDVFFATSDPKAIVIMHALHDLGLNIPKDVGVLGFDDVEISSMVEPALTTIAQPLYDIGAVAARNVINQIQYKNTNGVLPSPVHTVMSHQLIVRKSV